MTLAALALLAAPGAHAFCGTYVGQAGSELYNSASQVAITRQGSRTTLTLANDVQGDVDTFAIVIPVPEVLGEGDVRVVDPALFARLDGYSAPRLVKYTCDDFRYDEDDMTADASGGSDGSGPAADGSVTVEAEFAAGEYDITILSATESEGLIRWLQTNGYGVDVRAEELLGEYIEGGSYFFAARVALDRLPEGASWLSPLQFDYDAEVFGLPIRLGTLNSPGTQDLMVYTLTDFSDGRVGIANYPEVTVEDECMVRDERYDSFGDFWMEQVNGAFGAGASYLTEYAYGNGHCDPCTGEPPSDDDLAALGFASDTSGGADTGGSGSGAYYFFTRLHMRYGLVGVDQDLVLYASGDTSQQQIRYIEHESFLEDLFPVCGEGMVEDPGSCDGTTDTGGDAASVGPSPYRSGDIAACGGCATGGVGMPAVGAIALVLAGVVAGRRRL